MKSTLSASLLLVSVISGCASSPFGTPSGADDGTQPLQNDPPPGSVPDDRLWVKRVGDITKNGGAFATNVVTDSSGSVIVTGIFNGNLDLGTGLLTSTGKKDSYVAKFSSSGMPLWSRQFISSGDGFSSTGAGGVAVDASGNVYITGAFGGKVDFGGGLLDSTWSASHFAVKLASDGRHVWSKNFADDTYAITGATVAVDNSGDLLFGGSFSKTINFGAGGGVLVSGGGTDIYIAKLNSDGTHLWSRRFGDTQDDYGYALAVDPSGSPVLTGIINGPVSFGGGPLGTGLFVTKLNPDGSHRWSKRFGTATTNFAYGLATNSHGDIALAGELTGTVDFGSGPLTATGASDIFLATLAADGTALWAKHFVSNIRFDDNGGARVAYTGTGELVIDGAFVANLDLGGATLTANGIAGFVGKYSAGGTYLGSQSFIPTGGTSPKVEASGVAVDGSGHIVVVGYCQGDADLGSGPTHSKGFVDSFIAKLAL